MKLKYLLATSVVSLSAAAFLPAAAMAQSTGSVDFDEGTIIVTGTRSAEVNGIATPDTSKAKQVLGQEIISQQNPGQTVLDTINLVPGVSFQNNDAYGSSGGTLSIRGFDSTRISLTFDGVPLNDSGNYAIYSNQQLDPELIEQVNVNLGTTDVDSPTASAVGGTVNYRSLTPSHDFGVMLSGSAGEFDFMRIFAKVETGDLNSSGTRAWFALSRATNDNPFNNYGKVNKQQYNAKIYQPVGSDGDFIAVSGNWNQNRNNFFGSLPLRNDANRVVGSSSGNRFPANADEREYNINYPCLTATPQAGVRDTTNSCGTEFDRRYNPSNTGNIRGSSRFTLSDSLTLTVDPSFQYVKANGGGTTTAFEYGFDVISAGGRADCRTAANSATVSCQVGYIGGRPYAGVDLNGDGDKLDQVTVIAPSQTRTRRYGVIAGLRYDINDSNTLRLSYTHDNANHRQTGEVGFVGINGEPFDVFPVNSGVADSGGNVLQKRDRQSYAILNQVSGEYRGEFGDLTLNLGLRAPFFKRELNQNCFTTSASGFVDCFGSNTAAATAYAAANPTAVAPQQRVYKYDKLLPNVGFVYHIGSNASVFASYAQGLSVPGTDPLYNSIYFAAGAPGTQPVGETTDSFDLGARYRAGNVQAQLSGWYTKYSNRLASAYDPVNDITVFRNLGKVDKYGVDGSIAYQPIPQLALYVFGSYMKSEIKDDVAAGLCTANDVPTATFTGNFGCAAVGQDAYYQTAGKRESGSPTFSFGASARAMLGPVELGVNAKRTGPRYYNDENLAVTQGNGAALATVYPDKAPSYTLVNLDARLSLAPIGMDGAYVQLNVYNLFDEFFVGGFGGTAGHTSTIFSQIGAPRTISGTVVFKF